MPNIYKVTLLFDFNPATAPGAIGTARDGGFSESLWVAGAPFPSQFSQWAAQRVAMLPQDMIVVGWRWTPYEYTGNKLVPGLSTPGQLLMQGAFRQSSVDPDTAIILRNTAGAPPAKFRSWIHAVPNSQALGGQYTPNRTFRTAFQNYTNFLLGLVPGGFGNTLWFGRDPAQQAQRVLNFNGAAMPVPTLTTQLPTGAVQNDYIRLHRVYSFDKHPVKGSFRVFSVVNNPDGSATYGLIGFPVQAINSLSSGTARKDLLRQSPVTAIDVVELGDRKIGRPSGLYRGRRSKSL